MKLILTSVLTVALPLISLAADQTTMTVTRSDRPVPDVFAITNASSLKFAGSPRTLNVSSLNNSMETIPLGVIEKITFQTPTGVEEMVSEARISLKNSIVYDCIRFAGMTEQNSDLRIFDTAGRLRFSNNHWNGEDINISDLPAGFYIMKAGTQTFKFIKK